MIKVLAGLIAIVVAIPALLIFVGNSIDCCLNRVYKTKLPLVSDEAKRLHESLFIVDLHADTMLWSRDLRERSRRGHVDLPRLKDGNVALQVFGVVTKTVGKREATPDHHLIEEEDTECLSGDTWLNQTGWLQVTQPRWPHDWGKWFKVMFNLRERAIDQAERLKFFADNSKGAMRLITSAKDLKQLIKDRREARSNGTSPPVGALIALEGAHWLGEGDQTVANVKKGVRKLSEANFRMLAPVHRFNNALGASSEGCDQYKSFTDKGWAFIEEVNNRGIILDLAHATDTGIAEAAAASKVPVVVSHTGVRQHCRSPNPGKKRICDIARNMRDEEVRAVARTGGIVGVGIWVEAAGKSMEHVVGAFVAAHAALNEPEFVDEMRARNPNYDPFDHIALGSDFDGAVDTPIDVAELPVLTQALMDRHHPNGDRVFDDDAIRKISGVNACRVFATRLPGGGPATAEEICAPLMHGIASSATASPAQ